MFAKIVCGALLGLTLVSGAASAGAPGPYVEPAPGYANPPLRFTPPPRPEYAPVPRPRPPVVVEEETYTYDSYVVAPPPPRLPPAPVPYGRPADPRCPILAEQLSEAFRADLPPSARTARLSYFLQIRCSLALLPPGLRGALVDFATE